MRLIKGDVMKNIEIIMPSTMENPGEKPIVNINLARDLPNGFAVELMGNGDILRRVGSNIDLITKFDKLYLSQTLVKEKLFLTLSLEEPFKKERFIHSVIGSSSFNMKTT